MYSLANLIADLTSGDDTLAESSAVKFAAKGPEALPALKSLLSSPDPDSRWWAVRALAELDDPHVPTLLISALDDPELSVRQCAALGLRLHPEDAAITKLVEALSDGDPLLASLAADALVAIGEPAVPYLLEVMENGSRSARLHAVRALALIGDDRAIPALFAALDQYSAIMQYWAEQGLERMGVGMVFFKP